MVDCGVYVDGKRLPGKYTHAAALAKVREQELEGKQAFVWIGLHEPDHHQMQAVADVFCLHELAVEDAVHAHQRPKLERYDRTLFLVLKTVNYVEHESVAKAREIVETGEIMIFVGADFVVTVRHGEHSGLAGVRKRMDASPAIMKLGPYAIMHAIADHVVDSYLDVTDLIETDIDAMEEDIFSPRTHTNIECIYLLKREVVELRRAVSPLTVALQRLGTDHNDLISIEVRRYMRDVLDHNITASDRITSYDDMLSSLVQAALGRVDATERRHAQDIGLGGDRRGADRGGRHLRDELRAHARAALGVGLSGGAGADGQRVFVVVSHLPAQPLALTRSRRAPRRVEHVNTVLAPRLPHRVSALEPHPCRLVRRDRDRGQHGCRITRRGQRNIGNVAGAQQNRGKRSPVPQRRAEVDQRIRFQHQAFHGGCGGQYGHGACQSGR